MNISSRTPEGWPGRCPTCGHRLRVEASPTTHDATCPRCGALVWLSRLTPAGAGAALWAVAAAAGAGLAGAVLGLRGPELAVLAVLSVLLFGRRLPALGQRLAGSFRVA